LLRRLASVLEEVSVKPLESKNSCGHPCFVIGGPFIAEDPACPVHGTLRQKGGGDQRSESDLLMEVLARLPVGWEVRIGVERSDESNSLFLSATVWADNEDGDLPYDGLLFGVSAEAGDFMHLAKLLREAIERDKRIGLR
jgi:hypothetical protein